MLQLRRLACIAALRLLPAGDGSGVGLLGGLLSGGAIAALLRRHVAGLLGAALVAASVPTLWWDMSAPASSWDVRSQAVCRQGWRTRWSSPSAGHSIQSRPGRRDGYRCPAGQPDW